MRPQVAHAARLVLVMLFMPHLATAQMCPHTTTAAECSGTADDVNGELYCETGDFFDSSDPEACAAQACCRVGESHGRCESAVGDRPCYHHEEADCHQFEPAGEPECPCLVVDSPNGALARAPAGRGRHNSSHVDGYGHLCGSHDIGTTPFCTAAADGTAAPEWCSDRFCYVDPSNCSLASFRSERFPHSNLHYSYATCGSVNSFASNLDAAAAAEETTPDREKVKRALAIVEQTTSVPSSQIFLKLMSDIDGWDSWDVAAVRREFYVQMNHLIENENGLETIDCLHMGDSRGQWYGIYSGNLLTSIRPPDPGGWQQYEDMVADNEPDGVNHWKPYDRATINSYPWFGAGIFSDSCDDPTMLCDWPLWENCNDEHCNKENCCFTDGIFTENSKHPDDSSKTGEIAWVQQYDPRVRGWYINGVEQYSLAGQRFGWSGVYKISGSTGGRLVISATQVVPGLTGEDGTDATAGQLTGGFFNGYNFSGSAEELVLQVDGDQSSITLNASLTTIESAVTFINTALGGTATASATSSGYIQIQSASTGPSSSVIISENSSGSAAKMLFTLSAASTTVGRAAASGFFIGERIPHRGNNRTGSRRILDPGTWTGFDFTAAAETLVVEVDGTEHSIALTTDLTPIENAVTVINEVIGSVATATVDLDLEYITITSLSTGSGSTVRISESSGAKAKQMTSPIVKSLIATDLSLVTLSINLETAFPNDDFDTVYLMERGNGLLLGDSVSEGVEDESGSRKCGATATNDLIRTSAIMVENTGYRAGSFLLDESHVIEVMLYQRDETSAGWGLDWIVVSVQTITCPAGQFLQQQVDNVGCTLCQPGTFSDDGGRCRHCELGHVSNPQQSQCDSCVVSGPSSYTTDGISCVNCPAGYTPTEDRSSCAMCSKRHAGGDGTCARCDPHAVPSASNSSCEECPTGMTSDPATDQCTCMSGYYTATRGLMVCTSGSGLSEIQDSRFECETCVELECLTSCEGDRVNIIAGWSILRHDVTGVAVYSCRTPEACPGGFVNLETDNQTVCTAGYTGTLCGVCISNYNLKSSGACEDCGSWNLAGILMIIVPVLLILILVMIIPRSVYEEAATFKSLVSIIKQLELKPIGKILVVTFQIIGGLGVVLDISMPQAFTDFLKNFVQFFSLDIGSIFSIGCFTDGGYMTGLLFNVIIVLVLLAAVGADYVLAHHKIKTHVDSAEEHEQHLKEAFHHIDRDGTGIDYDELTAVINKVDKSVTTEEIDAFFKTADAIGDEADGRIEWAEFLEAVRISQADPKAMTLDLGGLVKSMQVLDAKSNVFTRIFVVAFFLYPGLTNKIFLGFQCRDLGNGLSVMVADYAVACDMGSGSYFTIFVADAFLLFLWPIGLPVALGYFLYKAKDEIKAGDKDAKQMFGFVISDYNPEHYAWEVIELARKLILSGLLGLVGRGTILQSVCGCFISFYFFAISYGERPFKSDRLNRIKIFSELQIFAVLLISVVLQSYQADFSTEVIGFDGYGIVLVVVTVAIMPVVTYLFVISAKELEEDMKEDQLFQKVLDDSDDTMKVKNPIPIKNPMLENLD